MSRTLATLVAFTLPFAATAAEPNLKAVEEQVQKVAEAVGPSVVAVVVSHSKGYTPLRNAKPGQLGGVDPNDLMTGEPLRPRWGRMQQVVIPSPLDLTVADNAADHLFGSGVVLDADAGLVLTPYHLIEGARKVYVRGASGKGSYADIHAADAKCDLAVLKLIAPPAGLKAVKLADLRLTAGPDGQKPTMKKGALVIALGHPTAAAAGEGSASLSLGTLSNVSLRSAQPTGQPGVTEILRQRPLHQQGGLIQIDARAAFGSTGAAVFDTDGALVGLGSSVAAVSGSEASGGYATPMDANYRRAVAVLKEGKEVEYGFLGVSPFDTGGQGVSVSNVTPGCPAALAGIQNGDVLLAIDGNRLTGPDDLLLHAGGALAGTEVTVEFDRNGRKQKAKLTLAKNVNQLPFIATVLPPTPFGIKIDYFSMRAAGGGPLERNPPTPPPGVLVREVEPGSAGERALKALPSQPVKGSWLVTHVDGKPVSTPKEFFALAAGKKSLKLHLADPDQPSTKDVITLP
jgi:serine protease Do